MGPRSFERGKVAEDTEMKRAGDGLQWGRANEERGNGTCVSGSIRTAEITDFERAHFHN